MAQIAPSLLLTPALLVASVAIAPASDRPQGTYSGSYVCQKLPGTRAALGVPNILRVPIDLVIKDDNVQFARPLLNGRGTEVVGNEMASGTINADGKIHITSNWINAGIFINAEYDGVLTATGGTFAGTQTLHVGNVTTSRTCTAALVQTAQAAKSTSPDEHSKSRDSLEELGEK